MAVRSVGVWAGFEHEVSFKREGISKYMLYLSRALLNVSDLKIEFWCYDFNRQGLSEMLAELMAKPEYRGRITIRTPEILAAEAATPDKAIEPADSPIRSSSIFRGIYEPAYQRSFEKAVGSRSRIRWVVPKALFSLNKTKIFALTHLRGKKDLLLLTLVVAVILYKFFGFWIMTAVTQFYWLFRAIGKKFFRFVFVNSYGDPKLAQLANDCSSVDVFLVPYIGIGNSTFLRFPKVMALHDISAFQFCREFLDSGYPFDLLAEQNMITFDVADRLAKEGTYFVSNSEYVMQTHGLGNIPSLDSSSADFVYLPVNVACTTEVQRESLLERHEITRKYIFFPSQVRPYKNVLNLLRAFESLVASGKDVELVLTASNWQGDPHVSQFIENTSIRDRVILTGNVSEADLFGLHRYAELTVVPTLFEGGLPWPALEAWHVETPVAMAAIPQVTERLKFVGIEPEDSGVALFDPFDILDMAQKIEWILEDPQAAFNKQRNLAVRLSSYTWEDAARKYHDIFNKVSTRATQPPRRIRLLRQLCAARR